jgi:hypothetical protein
MYNKDILLIILQNPLYFSEKDNNEARNVECCPLFLLFKE